ncbi:MAG: ankyrin repeat domain-containing protein [Hydrogenophaga sp.]|jgi:ankyrin repeat protein|uniref:ankyrin repeat domain-containing protein n=1 Tax=unclassified Hydrogenophaga TaxID=2610897 RepID=UPI0036D3AF0D
MSAGDWKELYQAACEGRIELVRYHVRERVNLDHAHPEYLSTPLVACILARQEAVAHLLLDHGANPLLLSEFEALTPVQAARQAGLSGLEARLRAMGAPDPAARQPARGGWLAPLLGRWLWWAR